jgi:hypothetical protein
VGSEKDEIFPRVSIVRLFGIQFTMLGSTSLRRLHCNMSDGESRLWGAWGHGVLVIMWVNAFRGIDGLLATIGLVRTTLFAGKLYAPVLCYIFLKHITASV